MILQTQDLRVDQEKKPCIRVNTLGLIQENLIKNSMQDCISYTNSPWSMLYYFSLL